MLEVIDNFASVQYDEVRVELDDVILLARGSDGSLKERSNLRWSVGDGKLVLSINLFWPARER